MPRAKKANKKAKKQTVPAIVTDTLKALEGVNLNWLGIESAEQLLKFNSQQIKFLEEFADCGEQTEAYRRAYPASNNATVSAWTLIKTQEHVAMAVAAIKARRLAEIDKHWVVDTYKKIFDEHYKKREIIKVTKKNQIEDEESMDTVEEREVSLTPIAMEALDKLSKLQVKDEDASSGNMIKIDQLNVQFNL